MENATQQVVHENTYLDLAEEHLLSVKVFSQSRILSCQLSVSNYPDVHHTQ